jgi:bifunctional DNA primase/polymerase-like protein/AAA domain-containing protein
MTLYEVAKEYVEKGWSVLPLQRQDKKPLMKWGEDGLNVRNRRLTDGELHSFFDSGVNNIGLAMGTLSGLVAIDVDSPEYFEEFETKYPTGLIASTPSGGRHYIYQYDKNDLHNIVGKLRPHVDVRAHGSYIVAYPSKLTNGVYAWIKQEKPAKLPETIRQEILSKANIKISDTVVGAEDGHELWLRVLNQGFTEGQHNVEVRDVARYLYRQGLKPDAIQATLSLLNAKDPTPQSQQQLEATIASGVSYEKSRLANKTVAAKQSNRPFDYSFEDVAADLEGKTGQWLIKDWLPVGSLIMMAAPPENYKTWLSFELAVQLALGADATPFLGQYEGTKEPQKVLIVQQEDGIDKIYDRLMVIAAGKWKDQGDITFPANADREAVTLTLGQIYGTQAIRENIRWHIDAEVSFDNPASLERLEASIAQHNIKLVIIDPVYTLGTSDNYFAELARKMVILKNMQAKYGVSFLLLHHTKKGDAKGRDAIYGSQLLNGAMEGIWLLREVDGERHIEKRGKAYTGEKYIRKIEFLIDDAESRYESHVSDITALEDDKGNIQKLNDNEGIMLALVQDKPGLNASEYKEFVAFSAPYMLKKLVEKNLIVKQGKIYFPIGEM